MWSGIRWFASFKPRASGTSGKGFSASDDLLALYGESKSSASGKISFPKVISKQQPSIEKDGWHSNWTAPKLGVPVVLSDDAASVGSEVPYRFRIAAPEASEKAYGRNSSPELTYTDFSGLRYPTLKTAENFPNYWMERGANKLRPRVSPLYLPAHKRLSPHLREVIWFLHTLDPSRFTKERIGERYGMRESSVRAIVHEMSEQHLINTHRLTRRQRLRLKEAHAVEQRKEKVFAARLGYNLIGDQPTRGRKSAGLLKGTKYHDPLLGQSIHVEAMSAFPLPSLRDPVQRRYEIDVEVKATSKYKVINWIDPSDKVTI